MICPFCKEEILDGAIKCKHCGSMISGESNVSSAPPTPPTTSTSSPAITDEDYNSFIGKNASKYIMKFKSFEAGGYDSFKATWHWPAFLVPFFWLLYRKLYLWALLAFVISIIPYINILAMIAFGIIGNFIYYKHAKKKIIEIKSLQPSETQRLVEYARVGGVSNVALWVAGVLLLITIIGILAAIAIPQFIQYQKRGYVSTINADCKSAYTASVAFSADHPNAAIDDAALVTGGYSASKGISCVVTKFYDYNNYKIKCTGDAAWSLGNPHAEATVVNGQVTITPASTEESLEPEPEPVAPTITAMDLYNNAASLCPNGTCTDPQKAIEYLTEAIRLQPDFVNAYNIRGIAYINLKQYPEAIQDYGEAIRLKPDDAVLFINRGSVYLLQGNKELGCGDLKKACELGNCQLLQDAKSKGLCH